MAVGKIRAGKSGSLEKLKRDLKDNGDDKWFYRLQADTEILVRFMAEPWDFINFMNHYNRDTKTSYPCNEGDCVGCDEGIDARRTFVAPIVDINESRARAMIVPKGVVDTLTKRAEKRGGTIMDRDFIIMREGSTMEDTRYEIEPQPPKRRNLDDYEEPDIIAMLEQQLEDAMNEGDDDEPPRRKSASKKATKKATKAVAKRRSREGPPDDDVYDYDEDDEPRSSTGKARARRTLADDDDDAPKSSARRLGARNSGDRSARALKPAKKVAKKSLRRR